MATGSSQNRPVEVREGSVHRKPGAAGKPATPGPPEIDYRQLFRRAPHPILVIDARGLCSDANQAACRLTGFTRKELLTMSLGELTLPLEQADVAQSVEPLVGPNGGGAGRILLRKGGSRLAVDVHTIDLGDGMSLVALRDLTGQRDIVERLNDALQRLWFHVERMPLAYIVFDTDFRVVEWNPAAERMFGYTKDEAVGRRAYDLVVPPSEHSTVDVVWENLLKGDTSSHSINENVRKDGSGLTCEWFNTPLRDSAGRIRGVASMAMDVSKREAMEAQIRSAQKLETLGVLASGIAHDFNSSLMVILGNTALLRSMKGLPGRAIEHVELIEDAGSRANELIKHLLAYARTGRHNPQPTDLNAVIRDAANFVRSSIGKKHELKISLARTLPTILADSSQIEQIILNLCLNAKQSMPEGRTVGITTRRVNLTADRASKCVPDDATPGNYVELLVSDTGCGMDQATKGHIFDPFFTTKSEGHGLGLAAVMGIMRQHRAVALIDSKPGRGTKIRVFFPAHRANSKSGSHRERVVQR